MTGLRRAPRLYKQPVAALAELTAERHPAMTHQMAAKSLGAVAVIQRCDETAVPVCGVERR